MAKGQIVSDLIVRLQAQGGQEVEYLRKELGQLQKVGKLTEAQLKNQVIAVKSLGKATAGTTNGLKAQIAAFEKIRGNARNTSNVYRDLTNDIRGLNRELKKQIDLETGVPGKAGGVLGLLGGTGKTRRLYPEKQPKDQTLKYLLGTQYFGGGKGSERIVGTIDEFSRRLEKLQRGFKETSWDDLEEGDKGFLRQLQLAAATKYKGLGNRYGKDLRAIADASVKSGSDLSQTGVLNKYQMQALGREENLDIRSKSYLDLVTKITGEQQTQNHLLEKVNNRSAEELATQRARTRQIAAQNKLDVTHIKSSVYQDYVRGLELDARKNRKTSPATMFGMKGRDIDPETKRWQGIDSFWKTTSVIANKLLGIKGSLITEDIERFDARDKGSLQKYWKTGAIRGSLFTQRKGDKPKSLTQFYEGMPLDDQGIPRAPRGFGKSKTDAKKAILGGLKLADTDPYGLGGPRQYDKTPKGIADKVRDLQQDLMALNPENKEWLQVTEEITAAEKELQAIVDKGTKRLKERRQEIGQKVAGQSKNVYGQKLLPAAGGTSAGKMQRDIFLAGGDTGFSADQYGPQLSSIQRATESQKDFVKRLQESVKTGKLNINTLTQQRAKLDEIRNGLDPTSAAFKRATQAIAKTDKALAKLNNNKFSGKNMGRTAQSILGASFFGGPAGFLGSTLGAGVEALRPGGDMAQGAVTGGLIASQVVQPVAGFISGASTYASDIAKLEIALEKATGKGEKFKTALDTAALVTKKFNVPQEIATRGMTRLAAAVTGAGGTVEHAAIAFHNVTAAIKGTAGSGEDVKSAITAMVQIFSKGRVSAEELSGQLGERFPGAVTKFQEANKDIYKSTADLQDALKKGEVGLKQLWEFVMLLGDDYTKTAERIGESDEEAGARAVVQMNALRIQLGQLLKPIGAQFQIIQAQILKDIIPAIVKMGEWAVKIGYFAVSTIKFVQKNFHNLRDTILIFGGGLVLGTLMKSIAGVIAGGITLTKVINGIKDAMIALNLASLANGWVALAAGIIAAAVAMDRFLNANKKLAERAASGDLSAINTAQKIVDEEQAKLDKRKAKFKAYIDEHQFKEGGIAYKGALANFKRETEELEAKIKLLSEAIESGNAANVEAANGYMENLKKVIEGIELPGFGGGKGGDGEDVYKGFSGGIKKFSNDVKNMAEEVANVTASWFDRMADHLANFVMTGKLKFKEFARSVIADIAKMIAKQLIFNMIAGFGNMFGPSVGTQVGGGLGGHLKKLKLIRNATGNAYGKNGIVPFYKGGIVNSPTLFPFAKGTGLMGEAGPEAIIPLQRGKNGKLGVAGGGGATTVNVSVDAKGTKVEGDGKQMAQLGKMLGSAIEAELIKQKRPGGLLA